MNRFWSKYGKEAPTSYVGVLVLTIALLILAYMIFLPECDKCGLLGEECPDYCEDQDNATKETFLLESPGVVDENPSDEILHDLGTINLYIRNEPEIKDLATRLIVHKSLFGNLDQDLSFKVKDTDNIDKSTLNFNVVQNKGNIVIRVNEREVYSGNPGKGSHVIDVPSSYLEEDNKLTISVSSPGLLFWSKNTYELSDVKLKTVFEVIQAKQTKTFTLSELEKNNVDDALLRYSAFCRDETEDNVLTIHLNGNEISSSLIDCFNNDRTLNIPKGDLEKGRNEIIFSITDGDFSLDDTELEIQLKDKVYTEYEFEIEEKDDFDEYWLRMDLDEVDYDRKTAEIIINGKTLFMDTTENTYEEEITSFVREGSNTIKIKPSNEFEIEEIKIWGE